QELGLYLWNKVPQHTEQTPQYGKIQDYKLSRGDFVFVVGSGSTVIIIPPAPVPGLEPPVTIVKPDIPEELEPVSFIQEYYTKIKKVPYFNTWNMLSMSLRNKVGFDNYVDWWDRKVDRVFLQNARAIGSNRVQVRLLYHMKNGRETCSIDTFTLHKGEGTWLIHDQQYKGCTRK
ncbi:MAG: hypothetical protein DRQ49_19100, partial [Gammaproteobacteria bacterium]